MKKLKLTLALAFIMLAICSVAWSYICGEPDLGMEMHKADVVCVGEVKDRVIDFHGRDVGADIDLVFAVDRVVKGEVSPGSTIRICYREPGMTASGGVLNPRQMLSGYDLVLLRRNGESYTFSRTALSSMPVTRNIYISQTESGDSYAKLSWEIINSLQDTSPNIRREVSRQLKSLRKSDVQTFVLPLLQSTDIAVRANAVAAALAAKEYSVLLPTLESIRSELEKSGSKAESKLWPLIFALKDAPPIGAENVETVSKGLQSTSPEFRELSSYILRRMKNKAAAAHLKEALDDSEPKVVYNAAMGLAEITKDYSHAPSRDTFLANPGEYVNYWKTRPVQ